MDNEARTLSGLNILAGIWLIIAPFVLNYASSGNKWQEVVFGAIIAILGVIRLAASNVAWPSWINLLAGIWIIIAPWAISNTTTAARWNEVIIGIMVAVLAWGSGAITVKSHHHGGQQPQAHV